MNELGRGRWFFYYLGSFAAHGQSQNYHHLTITIRTIGSAILLARRKEEVLGICVLL